MGSFTTSYALPGGARHRTIEKNSGCQIMQNGGTRTRPVSAFEAFGDEVDLARAGAGGRGFSHKHLVERATHVLYVGIGARALEYLHHEVALRRQRLADEIERKLDEIHGG